MFPAAARQTQRMEEEFLSKRKNWSSTRRVSPYPVPAHCVNAFPAQDSRDVLKTFQESYDRLRSNTVVLTRPISPSTGTDEEKSRAAGTNSGPNTESRDSNNLSYIGMIATAILRSRDSKLTLAGIYNYMEGHFFEILTSRPGWRNTVRHNLSLHDCFIKGEIAAEGKGRFWRIHPNYLEQFKCGKFNKNVLHNNVPPFYNSFPNYRFSPRENTQNPFPLTYHGTTWPNSFYSFASPPCPYPPLAFPQTTPLPTHIFQRRDYQSLAYRQCPGDFCDCCTRIRQFPVLTCSSNYNMAIENGTASASPN